MSRVRALAPGLVAFFLIQGFDPGPAHAAVTRSVWGRNGWPAIPAAPAQHAEWAGGVGDKWVRGPDGSAVYFTGKTRADGFPEVYSVETTPTGARNVVFGRIKPEGGIEWPTTAYPNGPERPPAPVNQKLLPPPSAATASTTTASTTTAPPPQPTVSNVGRETFGYDVSPEYARDVPGHEPRDYVRAAWVRDHPTNLTKMMRWSKIKRDAMAAALNDVRTGKVALGDLQRVPLGRTAAEQIQIMNEVPMATLTFGTALGVVAAVKLLTDYPNNPLAWSRYLEHMTDPLGWIELTGFIMVMRPYSNLLAGPNAPATLRGQLPIFTRGLMLATLLQSGFHAFATDPDVSACIGITNFKKTGNPLRDMAACDRAWARTKDGDLLLSAALNALPSVAAVAVGGSAFYVALYGLQKALPRIAVNAATATVGRSPWGIAIRTGGAITSTIAFYLLTTPPQELANYHVRSFLLTRGSIEGPVYARTVRTAERDLFATWERARRSGWRDPDFLANAKDVCYDQRRLGQKYFDCAKPRNLDFTGVLATYDVVHQKWRNLQLAPSLNAHHDWVEKVGAYRELMGLARDFYENALTKIAYSRANPAAPSTDPNTFSLANVGASAVDSPARELVRSVFSRIGLPESHDGKWLHVSTPRLDQYLLTSMACGPEVEGRGDDGFLGLAWDFVGDWVTGNTAPRRMIEDTRGVIVKSRGYPLVFHPPRLTTPLAGTNETICETAYSLNPTNPNLPWALARTAKDRYAPSTLDHFAVEVDGKTYGDLGSYVADHVRPNVLTPNGRLDFARWWDEHVGRPNDVLDRTMAAEYRDFVENTFRAALREPTYHWCGPGDDASTTPLAKYLRRLSIAGEPCAADRTHRLAYGTFDDLRDQARLYLAMMIDLYVANSHALPAARVDRLPGSVTQVENTVLVPARRVLDAYDAYARGLTDGTTPDRLAASANQIKTELLAFRKLIFADSGGGAPTFDLPAEAVRVAKTGTLATLPVRASLTARWMARLNVSLTQVVNEWQSYADIQNLMP